LKHNTEQMQAISFHVSPS